MHLRRTGLRTGLLVLACLALLLDSRAQGDTRPSSGYIVQSSSADTAAALVRLAGGDVTRPLALINGVAAQLNPAAAARLQADARVALHQDAGVRTSADPQPGTNPQPVGNPQSGANPQPATSPQPDVSNAGQQTLTEQYLLHPAAASGAAELRAPLVGPVATPNLVCQNQHVSNQGGTSQRELLGWGVTVAVIDSGFAPLEQASSWKSYNPSTRTLYTQNAEGRCIVYRDFLPVSATNRNDGPNATNSVDQYGHGTHVIATIADNRSDLLSEGGVPTPVGVAPKVNLLIARALDGTGAGTYADVIAAIEWVIQNKSIYNVRVLNLSLYSPVGGPYWSDPLNQAVMKAWQAGIVVVTAAGNAGPNPATITAPGNVPYVITVGALKSGRYTTSGQSELASYSSRGPTESAFVKPDVIIPASRTIAPMPDDAALPRDLKKFCVKENTSPWPCVQTPATPSYGFGKNTGKQHYFYLSGTSMAAAEISGLVALILQASPQLTNNQVKARLLGSARPVTNSTGQITYTPWEQGAGVADAAQAVLSTSTIAANQGMDIALDLVVNTDPQTHYWGRTVWDQQTQQFRLIDPATGQPIAVWSGADRIWTGADRIWTGADRIWTGADRIWTGADRIWTGSAELWAGSTRPWVSVPTATTQSGRIGGGLAPSDE